jgi:hypothetical protein
VRRGAAAAREATKLRPARGGNLAPRSHGVVARHIFDGHGDDDDRSLLSG